jgi:hypothetical protein
MASKRFGCATPELRRVVGTGLIVCGMLSLLAVITGWSVFQLAVLPTLAALFLVSGLSTRAVRLMIPAGILSGLSVGTVLANLLEGKPTSDAIGGIVVLCLGLGFALSLALQAVFATFTHWWPIIPATILVVIGTTLLVGGSTSPLLLVLGYLWPVPLLAVGIWVLMRALQRRGPEH